MLKLKITNLAAFDAQVRAWTKQVRTTTEGVAKGMAMHILKTILYTGPQYSGDFVANWNVSIGAPNYTFTPLPSTSQPRDGSRYNPHFTLPDPVAQEGDMRAIRAALGRVSFEGFRLGQTIWLANSAFHDESYSVLIEQNKIQFRPENPSGGRVVARAMLGVSGYSKITKDTALGLSRMGV